MDECKMCEKYFGQSLNGENPRVAVGWRGNSKSSDDIENQKRSRKSIEVDGKIIKRKDQITSHLTHQKVQKRKVFDQEKILKGCRYAQYMVDVGTFVPISKEKEEEEKRVVREDY